MNDIFPLEIWIKITNLIQLQDLFNLAITCKYYYNNFTSDPIWWPKIRKLWFLSDYNPHTLIYKKNLKIGETCFHYFRRKKNDDKFLKNLITEISINDNNNNNNELIQKGLARVYSNFSNFIPSLLSETLHITEKIYHNGLLYQKDFQNLQRTRNLKLDRIYIASNILESGKQLEAFEFYQKLNSNDLIETDLEDILLNLSLFDTRYHELIMIRHRVLKKIIEIYKMNKFSTTCEKLIFLSTALLEIIKQNAFKLYCSNLPQIYSPNLEDKSILRHYCGDSSIMNNHNYVILEKLTKLLEIKGVEFNDYGARIKENGITRFLLNNGKATYLLREDELPPILGSFPKKDKLYLLKKFRNYFGKSQSRFDGIGRFEGQDQIIYKDFNGIKIVCVERMNDIQGQVIICGGYINKKNWEILENIWEKKLIHKTIFNQYLLEKAKHKFIENNEIFKEIKIWSSLNLQIGDIIWSDVSKARGVIIEISDSEIGESTQFKCKDGNLSNLKGQPLFTIFFGAYGFATFSRNFLKHDISDRIEGLLVYDLIGKWFKTYDYKLHRFIYKQKII